MEITVRASTKVGHVLSVEDALTFGGHAAGICYMPDDFEAILNEPREKTDKRVLSTIAGGHHSVYDHAFYSLGLSGIPKILSMVLNNERVLHYVREVSALYADGNGWPREGLVREVADDFRRADHRHLSRQDTVTGEETGARERQVPHQCIHADHDAIHRQSETAELPSLSFSQVHRRGS